MLGKMNDLYHHHHHPDDIARIKKLEDDLVKAKKNFVQNNILQESVRIKKLEDELQETIDRNTKLEKSWVPTRILELEKKLQETDDRNTKLENFLGDNMISTDESPFGIYTFHSGTIFNHDFDEQENDWFNNGQVDSDGDDIEHKFNSDTGEWMERKESKPVINETDSDEKEESCESFNDTIDSTELKIFIGSKGKILDVVEYDGVFYLFCKSDRELIEVDCYEPDTKRPIGKLDSDNKLTFISGMFDDWDAEEYHFIQKNLRIGESSGRQEVDICNNCLKKNSDAYTETIFSLPLRAKKFSQGAWRGVKIGLLEE